LRPLSRSRFAALLAGNRAGHDQMVHAEMDKLARSVDAIVLGQISLAQIQHRPGVPVLQVGHSGLRTPEVVERSEARQRAGGACAAGAC